MFQPPDSLCRAWQVSASLARGRRRFTLCVDKTYALRGIDVTQLRQGRGYIGTSYHPKVQWTPPAQIDPQNTGFLPFQSNKSLRETAGVVAAKQAMPVDVEDGDPCDVQLEGEQVEHQEEHGQHAEHGSKAWDASTLDYANEIMECLVYDPAIEGLPRLSVASIPTSYECTGVDMLHMVGAVMQHAGADIKCISFDNATTHFLMKKFLLGLSAGLPESEVKKLPFWRDIVYEKFPGTSIPRWPFAKPIVNGEVLFLVFQGGQDLKPSIQGLDVILILSFPAPPSI